MELRIECKGNKQKLKKITICYYIDIYKYEKDTLTQFNLFM